jgi:hypothetical protein
VDELRQHAPSTGLCTPSWPEQHPSLDSQATEYAKGLRIGEPRLFLALGFMHRSGGFGK